MTIKTAYQQLLLALFELYNDREAANIADMVIEAITGFNKINRIVHPEITLNQVQKAILQQYSDELAQYKPVQYVLKKAWFFGLPFFVNESVLIPRPETEELVAWLLQEAKNIELPVSVLDIGCGSGCIPITIKHQRPDFNVIGVDISEKALSVAKQNAVTHQTNINFKTIDILNTYNWSLLDRYDFIISNPPYIGWLEKKSMAKQVVEFEPHEALFVPDNDPLLFYKTIAQFSKSHLNPNGLLFLEVNENLALETEKELQVLGYTTFLRKDLQGKNRMLQAKYNFLNENK
ncbi:MAG: peptide chain release factor N(5)-glutamine methyltransferase [Hydrotalea flava]|uniref:peptide chain release factor N(5)-glutamine methyltransferase n=1 Tax=Hydrotalea lipotrueae TaxID=2803817 RepID=UPI00169D99AD|nr:peptide chain release factor N(5)-glutamine methyltransferase [Hydrotalea lipotrueae]NIM33988.1 peptide chain release factor N(5)-glutamine methyltransferase [Hydrotalea flava]NIM36817.1 peptide chain release factor N(5)-glutamine methyltransferase [Hydrotalea flava]NIN02002.1 peptide chain release factor N(5)-glutamine methyltransferase [Hydrotalea flava]NIN13661.1 peptide chain release factor N(5)-glutamine methyltransferase [Hydrotalea flava]NIO92743.1 peptide chain release factor N(5)-g